MKKIVYFALTTVLAVSLFSCGSKKAPEETTEPEAPAVEETAEKAEETAEKVEEKTEEVVEETAKVDNTVALAAMTEARDAALNSGAETEAPEYLKMLDDLYASIKAKSENGEDVSAECADLAKKYQALSNYISAKQAKAKIDNTEKFALAQNVYDRGCTALTKSEELFSNPSATGDQLIEQTSLASTSFNSVLVVIYKQVAKDERDAAIAAKKDADSVKAGVAKRDDYKAAVELMNKADSLYAMNASDKAYDNYNAAKESFIAMYNDIYEKRAAAQAAIEAAKKRVEESANYALQADAETPLKEKVDGIEDEDAVLLEADDYEDPDAAQIDVPEEIDEGTLADQAESAANALKNAFTGEAK